MIGTSHLLTLMALQTANVPPPMILLPCTVEAVVSGDTLRCRGGTHLQLASIAVAGNATAARAELSRLALGKALRCEPTGGSSHGVMRAWCRSDQGDLGCSLVSRRRARALDAGRRCRR